MTAIASKTTHHCMIIIIPWIKTTASYDDVTVVLMTRVIYIVEFLIKGQKFFVNFPCSLVGTLWSFKTTLHTEVEKGEIHHLELLVFPSSLGKFWMPCTLWSRRIVAKKFTGSSKVFRNLSYHVHTLVSNKHIYSLENPEIYIVTKYW